jgi:pyridoxine 5-phosphate synthase
MIRLSVNVNKIATLRNSRGGREPSVLEAVDACLAAGAPGITVHPRADQRHITPTDVRDIARRLRERHPGIEFNIEGDPRPDLLDLVMEVQPDQCTLVPVVPGEITSSVGWRAETAGPTLAAAISRLRSATAGADRVELYTEPYARASETGADEQRRSFETFLTAAELAHALGLGVNAGHDLNLENLVLFRSLPHLDEVSIGHAIVSRAVFVGLSIVVREYLDVLQRGQ